MERSTDILVLGAGAAGLFASIWAARSLRQRGSDARVVAIDGARTLGAKILVAGGGRCNVTHHEVSEAAYAGSSRNAIKKVLRQFDVPRTIQFFSDLGVELKREDTGKLFPTTDSARSVLDALLRAAHDAGVELVHPWRAERVERIEPSTPLDPRFRVHPSSPLTGDLEPILARCVILATGGMSLPKSGSDGHGYTLARALGHSITQPVFPALVPLVLDENKTFLRELSGLTLTCTLDLASSSGKKLVSFTNSLLCTHFGLSGPAALDISRYFTDARRTDPHATLTLNFLPGVTFEKADELLGVNPRISIARRLSELVPDRLGRALCEHAKIEPSTLGAQLRRDDRRTLARTLTALPLPVTGDRGFTYAEVTAGGVPLSELHLETMSSRLCPNLHLCGEICDVDGRIGGFNFQWAWASGYAAGIAAAGSLNA